MQRKDLKQARAALGLAKSIPLSDSWAEEISGILSPLEKDLIAVEYIVAFDEAFRDAHYYLGKGELALARKRCIDALEIRRDDMDAKAALVELNRLLAFDECTRKGGQLAGKGQHTDALKEFEAATSGLREYGADMTWRGRFEEQREKRCEQLVRALESLYSVLTISTDRAEREGDYLTGQRHCQNAHATLLHVR